MSGINKVILVGNLGKDDPELKYTSDGSPVAVFSVATNETWIDKKTGEKRQSTAWHQVEAWNKRGENCAKYLKAGSKVYVEGKLVYSTNEKDGVKQYWTRIRATDVQFLDSKKS